MPNSEYKEKKIKLVYASWMKLLKLINTFFLNAYVPYLHNTTNFVDEFDRNIMIYCSMWLQ